MTKKGVLSNTDKELIAKFIGKKFNNSWNYIFLAIDKIESFKYYVTISYNSDVYLGIFEKPIFIGSNSPTHDDWTKKQRTHYMLVQFIRVFNRKKLKVKP